MGVMLAQHFKKACWSSTRVKANSSIAGDQPGPRRYDMASDPLLSPYHNVMSVFLYTLRDHLKTEDGGGETKRLRTKKELSKRLFMLKETVKY